MVMAKLTRRPVPVTRAAAWIRRGASAIKSIVLVSDESRPA